MNTNGRAMVKISDVIFCDDEISANRDSRGVVIAACYAANGANSFAQELVDEGVQCVIGSTAALYDYFDYCAYWADLFWDYATDEEMLSTARSFANYDTALNFCDLDSERGDCDTTI